jgi:hypothetical protein
VKHHIKSGLPLGRQILLVSLLCFSLYALRSGLCGLEPKSENSVNSSRRRLRKAMDTLIQIHFVSHPELLSQVRREKSWQAAHRMYTLGLHGWITMLVGFGVSSFSITAEISVNGGVANKYHDKEPESCFLIIGRLI